MNSSELLIDAHTHSCSPVAALSLLDMSSSLPDFSAPAYHAYVSLGIHPLSIVGDWRMRAAVIERAALCGNIAAIGECGFDRTSGVPITLQAEVFAAMADIAAKADLPVVLHVVRAADMILGEAACRRKECSRWMVHGFRGKPETMHQYLRAGMSISFGLRANLESVKTCPSDRILIETDTAPDSELAGIYEVYSTLRDEDLVPVVRDNFLRIFGKRE